MLFPLVYQSTLNELGFVRGEERTYSCDVCNKSFRRTYDLKRHRLIHSGENPFCFNVCNKSFRQDYMKCHQRIHSEERPYCC
jgi:KRAB domain-containing zinc finger protein